MKIRFTPNHYIIILDIFGAQNKVIIMVNKMDNISLTRKEMVFFSLKTVYFYKQYFCITFVSIYNHMKYSNWFIS
jgi:translation elongation factor EF-1alpha